MAEENDDLNVDFQLLRLQAIIHEREVRATTPSNPYRKNRHENDTFRERVSRLRMERLRKEGVDRV